MAAPGSEISKLFLKKAIDFKNIFSEIFINLNESLKHHL